jgi:hypothetical protein
MFGTYCYFCSVDWEASSAQIGRVSRRRLSERYSGLGCNMHVPAKQHDGGKAFHVAVASRYVRVPGFSVETSDCRDQWNNQGREL